MKKDLIGNKSIDITGQRWGRLKAIKQVGYYTSPSTGKRQALWLWQCDCGNVKEIPATQVKNGGTRSCGCIAKEHITNLNKKDIKDRRFGRLTAIRPTEKRDKSGNIIWELACDCGNTVFKSVNTLKSGRVLSCGCWYKESRKEVTYFRKDFIEHTSLSSIVGAKKLLSNNTSGHTGVYLNKRNGRWEAYINYQKARFYLGSYEDIDDAITARNKAEINLHDPIVIAHWDNLTENKKKIFAEYLRSIGLSDKCPK